MTESSFFNATKILLRIKMFWEENIICSTLDSNKNKILYYVFQKLHSKLNFDQHFLVSDKRLAYVFFISFKRFLFAAFGILNTAVVKEIDHFPILPYFQALKTNKEQTEFKLDCFT